MNIFSRSTTPKFKCHLGVLFQKFAKIAIMNLTVLGEKQQKSYIYATFGHINTLILVQNRGNYLEN